MEVGRTVFMVLGIFAFIFGLQEFFSIFAMKPTKRTREALRDKMLYRLTTKNSDLGDGKVQLKSTVKPFWKRDATVLMQNALFFFVEKPTQYLVNGQNVHATEVLVEVPFSELEKYNSSKIRYRKHNEAVVFYGEYEGPGKVSTTNLTKNERKIKPLVTFKEPMLVVKVFSIIVSGGLVFLNGFLELVKK
ncbi:hypothetical protein [Alicyclobacillus sp. SP_1]|uniref:hypothetical protein n=1 Tax=Alicyclobacillus sp. SP_1 TaxID=2942475 RepID=UPI0021572BC8|nr:hypothetical protein [Alicyclobacillus sp. SP_1]